MYDACRSVKACSPPVSLMHGNALDVEVEIVVCPQADDSFGAHALGIRRAHSRAVDLEAQLGRIALGIDLQEIRPSALSLVYAATRLLVPQHRPVAARARTRKA
jgi:hypothetical protein